MGAPPRRALLLVGALVLGALVLRLPTAGEQSFWLDEVYTGRIVDGSLGHAWSTIQRTENTPPLFYLLDWVVGRLFGTGELALRSLSAVAGALAVWPVVRLTRVVGGGPDGAEGRAPRQDGPAAPRDGASADRASTGGTGPRGRVARAAGAVEGALGRGTGPAGTVVPLGIALAAGALLAVNPLAQWFSQEARSYGVFVLLAATAWVFLLQACDRPSGRRLWLWAVVAVAVAWTHYFGGILFLVGWGAIGLVVLVRAGGGPGRLRALLPLLAPAALSGIAVAALAPIAKNQQSTDMYQAISNVKGLGARLLETPKQFAVGYNAPAEYVLGAILVVALTVVVVAGAWPRDGRPTRGTALLGLCVVVWILPIAGLAVGFDVVLTRNYVLLIPPLAVLAALGAWRLGRRAVVGLAVVGAVQLATIVVVALTPVYQRDDWRGALRAALGGQPGPEVLMIANYQDPAATYYAPTLRQIPAETPVVAQTIAIVDRLSNGDGLSRIPTPQGPAGFRLVRAEQGSQWRVFVWRAAAPTPVLPQGVQWIAPQTPRSTIFRP
ncbi:hypothetical protein [Patulibacter minatonensis]|uniref:hypothetical protein n=1 Tax=Patulibacter minatonensis TaxID=298163 RepID=UPI00047A9AF5|nr:hypothetical protein [Patulibacter minatonensis]